MMKNSVAHADMFVGIRKKYHAFTLAEVLVTLGIIGIVAAMTIPALISRYRTFVLQQQFKKVYAAIAVGAEKVQFDMGENVNCFSGPVSSYNDCSLFYRELAKQLNVIQTCKNKALEQGCLPAESYKAAEEAYADMYPNRDPDASKESFINGCTGFISTQIERGNTVYVLNGGFLMIMFYNGQAPLFLVDINGKNRPNKWGHDLFAFSFKKKKQYESYFVLEASDSCMSVEKGGFTTIDFFNRINRGTANF